MQHRSLTKINLKGYLFRVLRIMNKKLRSYKTDSSKQHNLSRSVHPPIFYLRDSFRKSLELAIGQKIPKEVAEIIAIDLTPAHVTGDFTFAIFEIAKILKVEYSNLALTVAENLRSYNKQIHRVEIVNGYINITVEPNKFYTDSLKYVLKEDILQEPSKSKKIKTVLLIANHIGTDAPVNKLTFRFMNRLYLLPSYIVKMASLNENLPLHETRSFLGKMIKVSKVKDFGNNVITIQISRDKYMLLQKQDKTPTILLNQLASLTAYIKDNNPTIIIFSLESTSQSIHEFLTIAYTLRIFKKGTRIEVVNDSDLETRINSYNFKTLKDLHTEIGKSLQDESNIGLEKLTQFKDTEMAIARLISYAPEVFRRSLTLASPRVIINYYESFKNPLSELYRSIENPTSTQKNPYKQLLLKAAYKILNTSLKLIEN